MTEEEKLKDPIEDLDDAITRVEFEMKRKRKALGEAMTKLKLTENDRIKINREDTFLSGVASLVRHVKRAMEVNLGKMPPAAVDLEESILGAIILESGYLQVVKPFLRPDHFYDPRHIKIYQAILDLGISPIDMRTVVLQLRKNNDIEKIGGSIYIAQLTATVSQAANVEWHARAVMEFAIKREMIKMASMLLNEAYEDSRDCFVLLRYAEKNINRVNGWLNR